MLAPVGGGGLIQLPALRGPVAMTPVDGVTLAGAVLTMLSAVATAYWHRLRLVSLVTLSVVGLGVVLAFARFAAPDLALTQISVEVVTIVLLMLALTVTDDVDDIQRMFREY